MALDFSIHPIRWERFRHVSGLSAGRDWLALQADRGLAGNTIDAYGRGLEMYLAFLEQRGLSAPVATRGDIAAYLRHLASRRPTGLANATLQQRLTVVRLFHCYLVEEGICSRNPVSRREGARIPPRAHGLIRRYHRLPWIPSEGEWLAILQATRQESLRNRLMLAMSYDAALRREELCGLATDDVDPAHRLLRIRAETTKGRRERVVPYSVATGELYVRYLVHRRGLTRARGPLFVSESPRNRGKPLTVWTWSKTVSKIAGRSQVPQLTTHTLRHLCLTDLARGGWDLHEIATFAGHRSVSTTLRYIHLSGRELAEKVASGMAEMHAKRVRLLAEPKE